VFDEAHARFFFGREAMTQHLIEALRPRRFLAIIGPSGSGKSSIARAGLLPRLRAGALPESERWSYLIFKPGPHPLEELAVSPMDETDVRRAIEEPAREVGLHYEHGLVERILRDVGSEPGALPLMEHALLTEKCSDWKSGSEMRKGTGYFCAWEEGLEW
jgi:hypothetical protein